MSWQDDQSDAFSIADDLGIAYSDLQQWHDISDWSWADIADRLAVQQEYGDYASRDADPPEWVHAAYYEYLDWDDYPDWMIFYHEK